MNTSDQEVRSVRVTVGQEKFQIQTDLNDAEIEEIVNFVSKKMDQHLKSNPRLEIRKQLILVAMDIASELFDTRRRLKKAHIYYQESQKTAGILASMLEEESSSL